MNKYINSKTRGKIQKRYLSILITIVTMTKPNGKINIKT